jgi:curved DNA-binding protein CbpA
VFVDFYEVLQISFNADQETIHRVYRMQAQRFHPDNLESGDAQTFRQVSDAYQVLSDPQKRSAYDAEYRNVRRDARDFIAQANSAGSVDDERQRRQEILFLLYKKRQVHPDQPSMSLRDLEELLATPRQRLEFSLWFLKEGGYLLRTDSARHTITMKGAECVESATDLPSPQVQRITDGSRVA